MKILTSFVVFLLLLTVQSAAFAKTYDEAYQEAKIAFEAKNYPVARTLMEAALKLAATPHEKNHALFRIGETYRQEGNGAKAIETWKNAATVPNLEKEDRFDTLLVLASAYHDDKKYQLSRETVAPILQDAEPSEKQMPALMLTGLVFMDEGKFEECRAVLNKVIFNQDSEPGAKFMAQMWIGLSYAKEGKPIRAREEYSKLRDANEKNIPQWLLIQSFIAVTFKDEKNYSQARAELTKILTLPTPPELSPEEAHALDVAKVGAQGEIVSSYIQEKNVAQARLELEKYAALPGVTAEMKAPLQKAVDALEKAP